MAAPREPPGFASRGQQRTAILALVGVATAAAGGPLPFGGGDSSASFQVEGMAQAPGDPGPHGRSRVVSPKYFAALRIPVKRGRVFTDDDRIATGPVAVIDENLARRYWPGQDAVGRRMRLGQSGDWLTIVGVVVGLILGVLGVRCGKIGPELVHEPNYAL